MTKTETTIEQEAEALQLRAVEHAAAGRIEDARRAFRELLAIAVPHLTPEERRQEADAMIEAIQADMAKEGRLAAVQGLYDDEAKEGAGFFQHVGLPPDATWAAFRAHYAVGEDDVDANRAFGDLESYPPIAARIAELKAEQQARA